MLKDEITRYLPTVERRSVEYSVLGAFRSNARLMVQIKIGTPFAERVRYAGRGKHHATRTRAPLKWALSRLRDVGDVLFGSFLPA